MTIVPYVHGTPAWHELRARHVGASEAACLLDVQPAYALSRYALWMVKAGKAPPPPVDNERVRWGLRLEPVIAECAAETRGWALHKGGYASDPHCPGLGASLDYVVDPSPADLAAGREGPGVLEVKNADWMIHRRTWADGEPPMHILLQLEAQLAASGYSWGCVACLVGGNDLRMYDYIARPRIIAVLREKVREFWQSIRDNRPPPPDGSDGASAVIRSLFPDLAYEPADLRTDNLLPSLCADFLAAAADAREAKARADELRNRILEKVGPHRKAMVHGFNVSVAVTEARPEREPPPGYLIPGRTESRRLIVNERAIVGSEA